MTKQCQEIVNVVYAKLGMKAAYAVSVALHAADTLRLEQPEKFKQAWGTAGYKAIAELFKPD